MAWNGNDTRNGGRQPLIQSGTVALPAVAAGAIGTPITVTFPTSFPGTPVIGLTSGAVRVNVGYSSVGASGFTINFANWTGTASGAATVAWTATY